MTRTRNLTLALSLAHIGYAVAYDNTPGWKKDADGKLVTDADGNPMYVDSAGAEKALGADTVSRLNGEAKTMRERAEAAEATVRKYGDFKPEQVSAATEALQTVKDLKSGDLTKKEEVERIRRETAASYDAQLATANGTIEKLTATNTNMTLTNAFASSQFMKDQVAIPAQFMQDSFGKNFRVEDGAIVALDSKGEKLLSTKRGGEYATFDEALQSFVEQSPFKDSILKAQGGSGTGNGGAGGGRGGNRIVRRSDFDAMSPVEKQATAAKQKSGELTIAD